MSFRKILCPTDFSPGSKQALQVAARLANEAGAELVLVHAWHVPPLAMAGEYSFPADFIQQMVDDARRGLDAVTREAAALGVRQVSSKLLTGVPWSSIVGVLEDRAFDLVVLGTHGRTGLAHVLLGSVAEQVVRHAPCSVLAIHPGAAPTSFSKVLCPVDFSDSSRQAAGLAATLVEPSGSITLLHVVDVPVAYAGEPPLGDFVRSLDKYSAVLLDEAATQLRATSRAKVTTRSRIGRPGAQALAEIEAAKPDLVVLGSHGRTGLARVLLGSVAEKVVRHAACPVLVARPRA